MIKQAGIGIDIGGTSIKYGLVSSEGKVYWESERPTMAKTNRAEVEQNILDVAAEALDMSQLLEVTVETIGVGTPGLVSGHKIVLGGADNIVDWVNVPLGELISTKHAKPTFVANDADMMAVGEFRVSGGSHDSVIFITLGTGIGGAIIIDGQLFQGHFGLGGELGVFPMVVNGEVKNWEDVASTSALIKMYRQQGKNTNGIIDGKYIVEKYTENEILAKDTIFKWSKLVGMGIAGYINIFNPKKVIIGGGISDAGELVMNLIKENATNFALKECRHNVEVVSASLGNRAGFIGAAIFGLTKNKI